MKNDRHLGLYWGEKEFSIVQVRDNTPTIICRGSYLQDTHEASEIGSVSSDIHTVGLIQKILRDNRIDAKQVSLSVSNHDLMIRSFIVPSMSKAEMDRVVSFEIKKYIPFPVDQIVFVYHALALIDKGAKQVRVVLAAMRREVLYRYTNCLDQAGLTVVNTEPAPTCLLRVLIAKKEVKPDGRVIILVLDKTAGQIIFVNKGVSYFVRDFSLVTLNQSQLPDEQVAHKKTMNEIHMACDFYYRQYDEEKMAQMLLISSSSDSFMLTELSAEFGLSVKQLSPNQIINGAAVDKNALFAYGAAISGKSTLKYQFDLSKKQSLSDTSLASYVDWSMIERLLKVLLCGAVIIGLIWFAFEAHTKDLKLRLDSLYAQQRQYQDMTAEEILAISAKNNRLLNEFKGMRFSSQHAQLLLYISQVFSEGMWLRDLSIKSDAPFKGGQENALVVDVTGYVALRDPNKEMRAVNELTLRIKKHPVLGKYFKNAVVNSVERQSYMEQTVTVFTITCSS